MPSITPAPAPVDLGFDVESLSNTTLRGRRDGYGQCVGVADDAKYFPNGVIGQDKARTACAGCPVQAECLELALREEGLPYKKPEGIFGGTTPQARRNILRTSPRWRSYTASFLGTSRPRVTAQAVCTRAAANHTRTALEAVSR